MLKLPSQNQEIGELLFKSTNDSVLLVDEFGIVQYSNTKVFGMFGYNRKALFQAKIALLFPIKFFSVINTYIYRCTKNNYNTKNSFKAFEGRKRNGVTFPVEVSIQCSEYNNAKVALIRIVDKTTIETKVSAVEKQLLSFLVKEKDKNQKQMQFVSKTSHELRTPLTTILNATQLLDKCKGSTEHIHLQEKNIDRIKGAIEQLTGVLNDFLTLNKIKEQKSIDIAETQLPSFSNEIIDKLKNQNKSPILYKHQGIETAKIDRNLMSSVFDNLLSNAIKYSPNNAPIHFKTIIENNTLTAICTDNGIGIPKKARKNLFERYYRANNTSNIQGTGLGLSIVKEHLQKVGGSISFKSKEHVGSVFTVKIPVEQTNNRSSNLLSIS
ncbi:MAG: PAS domain-containing sensor histidine kinase [Flavobacteriaceae bacterium]